MTPPTASFCRFLSFYLCLFLSFFLGQQHTTGVSIKLGCKLGCKLGSELGSKQQRVNAAFVLLRRWLLTMRAAWRIFSRGYV